MQNTDNPTDNISNNNNKTLPLVLLVEDNIDNKELTIIYLKSICNIDYAQNGEIALKMITKHFYELILMDINLGAGIDGWETIKQIRKIKEYANIPIIALTAYSLNEDSEEIQAKGATHFIAKPFDKKTIHNLVNKILQTNQYFLF